MEEWAVTVEVLTSDFGLVNRWDPPRFACLWYGIHEVEGHQHLTATVVLSAADEATALASATRMLGEYIRGHEVIATRARPSPTEAAREPYLAPVRWQCVGIDAASVDMLWDSPEPLARIDVEESATAATITLFERVDPEIEGLGGGIHPQRLLLALAAPLGDRELLDGGTGRAPDDLSVWDFDERARRERLQAVDLTTLEPLVLPDDLVHRA
jgi:hypothetical protein